MASDVVSQAGTTITENFKSWKARKQFVKGMIETFGTSLEYDGTSFLKVTWLIEASPLLILTCKLKQRWKKKKKN